MKTMSGKVVPPVLSSDMTTTIPDSYMDDKSYEIHHKRKALLLNATNCSEQKTLPRYTVFPYTKFLIDDPAPTQKIASTTDAPGQRECQEQSE